MDRLPARRRVMVRIAAPRPVSGNGDARYSGSSTASPWIPARASAATWRPSPTGPSWCS